MTNSQLMVEKYLAAELAILDGKSVTFNGRSLSYENIKDIRDGRKEWEKRVASEKTTSAQKKKTIGGLSMSVGKFGP